MRIYIYIYIWGAARPPSQTGRPDFSKRAARIQPAGPPTPHPFLNHLAGRLGWAGGLVHMVAICHIVSFLILMCSYSMNCK